jgi:hypothetical protein
MDVTDKAPRLHGEKALGDEPEKGGGDHQEQLLRGINGSLF